MDIKDMRGSSKTSEELLFRKTSEDRKHLTPRIKKKLSGALLFF